MWSLNAAKSLPFPHQSRKSGRVTRTRGLRSRVCGRRPLTHPQVVHDLDRLLELHWDVHRDVVVETGTHGELLRQRRPVVFPAWNRGERAALRLAHQDPGAFPPLAFPFPPGVLTSGRAQRLHLPLPAVQLGGLLLQLLLPLQQLGGSLRLLLRSESALSNGEGEDAEFDAGAGTGTFFCGCE